VYHPVLVRKSRAKARPAEDGRLCSCALARAVDEGLRAIPPSDHAKEHGMNTPSPHATEVATHVRLRTLLRHFGSLSPLVEIIVYSTMRHLAPTYRGANWRFYELSNGGFYMAPELERIELQVPGNKFRTFVSADAAGIVACLFAFDRICCQHHYKELADYFDRLLEFASRHPEAKKILAAID
jgi:Antirestriction protein